ncbi:flagellar protein FlaG [Syntrophothermus lipocalidus]|uniref:Flagellar protein FlaG protein n=1 Tax=Syntrophothermus lipocalidus (strain DSM 12680 / TGB-C1) TaxID=643648 RepID=D7CPK2_SYNLT|nr:flagellar protein FlaG [Syntrophothermus lipocalidus]ADI02637.1 flagellar protein FlaG protein [Syntrophothermus lipocalidus DSM 12680]
MRIEGPGTASDVSTAKIEPVRPVSVDMIREKRVLEKTEDENRLKISKEADGEKATREPESLDRAVDIANKAMEISGYNLQFRIHKESGRVQVKVVDAETQEVIREIPPEQMLRLSASIMEMLENFHKMVGLMVDELV